ncbi:hypothetical protein [Halococcus sp. AFM35]|uniref:hypothetical protein n=1 Tax=Halococcus sp. AFM35 TaxID=3421653 RepID=UPI003EBDD0F3
MTRSRRRFLATIPLAAGLTLGGCLMLDPTVSANVDDSAVFEEISTSEPWVSGRIKTSVTLAPNATSEQDVTDLTVTTESGKVFDSTTVASGQTSGLTLYLPAGENATITATDSVNGTTIETHTVSTGGNELL